MYINKTGEIFESKMAGHYMLQMLKMKQNICMIKMRYQVQKVNQKMKI